MGGELPPRLAEVVEDLTSVPVRDRLLVLLELADELPALPGRLRSAERLERVDECQSPVHLVVEVEVEEPRRVHLHFDVPPEAPTTRGFAGILHTGLDGEPAGTVLSVPGDLHARLGLAEAVSPLRLRGLAGMLHRVKRQVRGELDSAPEAAP